MLYAYRATSVVANVEVLQFELHDRSYIEPYVVEIGMSNLDKFIRPVKYFTPYHDLIFEFNPGVRDTVPNLVTVVSIKFYLTCRIEAGSKYEGQPSLDAWAHEGFRECVWKR